MRGTMVSVRACVLLLLCGGLAVGQQPTGGSSKTTKGKPAEPAPGKSLEDSLAAALKNNPDIRVAEAKVREAEAEWNRSRLQATQKVVTLYRGIEAQKALVLAAEAELSAAIQERADRVPSATQTQVEKAKQNVAQAKAKLNELEAELTYLTGQQPTGVAGTVGLLDRRIELMSGANSFATLVELNRSLDAGGPPPIPRAPVTITVTVADQLRKALDQPVAMDFAKKTPADILKELQKSLPGVPIRIRTDLKVMNESLTIQLSDPISLGAAFQLLEDETKGLRFLIREYGIIITHLHHEDPPQGAQGLVDFWKALHQMDAPYRRSSPSKGGRGSSDGGAAPPGGQGKVKGVDVQNGLVSVEMSPGADLARGHTLEVYRLTPTPVYLGRIQILEVKDGMAVGKLVARPSKETIQPGDQVASHLGQ